MKFFLTTLFVFSTLLLVAQTQKPAYCEEGPSTYGSVAAIPGGSTPPPLPRFATTPTKEYKIQVAILRYTDPSEYPFHSDLVARYRPCEQVWVVESRESYANRAEAVKQQDKLKNLGYSGAYITELMGYQ
ncbi:MAG: hypothetical protein AAF840_11430 [Bacteroidota bacterium]